MMLKLKTDALRVFGRTNIDAYLPGGQKIIGGPERLNDLTKARPVAII
jgi:hypothetical protein